MAMWNPWRGCHRYSEGCRFCYIHKGDAKRGTDTDTIVKTDGFNAPIIRKKNGEYKMNSGTVYLCFSTDFLLPEADGRTWTECDINTLGADSRGAERIVFSNDGLIYYTGDHYKTFELLYGGE